MCLLGILPIFVFLKFPASLVTNFNILLKASSDKIYQVSNTISMHVSGVYSWTQTKKSIDISIPLKGVSPKKIDILLTETYIKVSYRPFLLEIDLFKAVDEVSSRAVLKSGTLIIHLRKKDDESGGDWDSICFEGTKKEIQLRRSQAMSNREELVKIVHNKAKDRQIEEGRIVLRKQVCPS